MEGQAMVKVYCGEEQVTIAPQDVRDAQVAKVRAMLADWTRRKQQKRKFEGRQWVKPGEAIMAQLKAEETEQ